MTTFLLIAGAATATGWVFRLVDAIEAPRKGGSHNVYL